MELEQSPGDRAPVVRMVTKPAGLLADSPGSPSRSHPGNASAAQTGSPLNASPGSNDDDPEEEEEEDEDYVPRRGSRRKRRHSSRSDATRCAGRSKKRRHTSKSPKLGSAGSSTMVGEEEDSDETPVVPTSVHKSWRSTNVAYMTVDASKANYDSGGADTSSSNTFPSGPPDASAFDLEDPIQRRNNHARTFPSEDTTYRAHDTLPLSPTSDVVDSRNANDQRTHARDSTEFVDSRRSLMQASPSRPDFSPATRAREDSSEPADKPGVEIFVLLRGTMKHWNTTLSDKKLKTISDHVSRVTSRNEIQRIGFYLETLKEKNDLEYFIERGDTAVFKAVIRKFNKRMDKCKDAGEDSFEIHLDPDPEQHNAEKAKVAQVSKRDGQRW